MELFKLFGSIIIDDDKAIKSLNDFDKKTSKAQKTLANFGKAAVVAGTAVAAGLGAMLVSGTRDAMDAEEKLAQLDAVLKSTGGSAGMTRESVMSLAEGLEQTTKFSAEMALEAQSLLLTFTNIGKDTFPRATQAAADMATAMGTDMAGQSIALGKALNDPTKGITALTRVGVTFTEEQKKAIKAMQESGDMAGAQAVILAELEKEFGGSAEAAGDTFAGQLVILKNQLGAVAEEMAVQLLPYLNKFLDWVNYNMPTIKRVFTDVMDKITGGIEWVTKNLNWLLPVLAGVLAGFVAFQIISVISALFTVVSAAIAGASGAMAIFNAIMLANPIGLVAIAIGVLVAAIAVLWQNWDKVSKLFTSTFDSIMSGFSKLINGFIDGLNWVINQANALPGINIPTVGGVNIGGGGTGVKTGSTGSGYQSSNKIAKYTSIGAYASGGIAYGDTLAQVGEYVGVKNNPEVIAPLDKLKELLGGSMDYDLLGDAVARAMRNVSVVMDDEKVGRLVDRRIMKGAV